jgi:hypothetical protein
VTAAQAPEGMRDKMAAGMFNGELSAAVLGEREADN